MEYEAISALGGDVLLHERLEMFLNRNQIFVGVDDNPCDDQDRVARRYAGLVHID
jgi:hypothetical protein